MSKVHFQDKSYTLHQIQKMEHVESPELILIKKWLSGDEEFNFQTSGSTGLPKVIKATRKQLVHSAKRTLSYLNISKGMVLNQLSCLHVGGAMQVIRALVGGLDLVFVAPDSKDLNQVKVDWSHIALFSLVPYQLDRLLKTNLQEIKSIQNILLGGAAISQPLKHQIIEFELSNVYETYGMTETLSHIALKKTLEEPHFTVLSGVTIEVDHRMCIIVHDTLLGIERLVTNDLVNLITPKTFKWLGRHDHVINSGGLKHVVELLESKLSNLIPDHSLIIYPKNHQTLGQTIHLLIESDHEIESLSHKCTYQGVLDKYQIPKTVAFMAQFCKTPTHKIIRGETIQLIEAEIPIS